MSASRCGWRQHARGPPAPARRPRGSRPPPRRRASPTGASSASVLLRQGLPPALRLLAADGVDRLVVHDRQQPGGDAAPAAVVGRRIAPHAEEDLLQDVLGQCVVGEDPAGQREGRPAEPLVEVVDGARGRPRGCGAGRRRPRRRPRDAAPGSSRLPWSHASFAATPLLRFIRAPAIGHAGRDDRPVRVTGVTDVKEVQCDVTSRPDGR